MTDMVKEIVSYLDKKKAESIKVVNIKNVNYFTKSVIICTTLGEQHTYSLLDGLKRELKGVKKSLLGLDISKEWVVLDLGDAVVHLMSPKARYRYDLEGLLEGI